MTKTEFLNTMMPLKDKLFRFALRMMKNREDAEDCVQEVYIKLWQKKEYLQDKKNPGAYAMTVTKNHCIDKLRSKHNKSTVSLNDDIKLVNNTDPGDLTDFKTMKEFVKEIIAQLPERQKMIIHLRDIELYTNDEIAEITGFNKNVIKVNLSRARKTVRDKLKEIYEYEYK